MTIAQIVALVLAGPLGLMCLAKLIVTLVFRNVRDFEFIHAVLLVVCTVVILITFLGVQ